MTTPTNDTDSKKTYKIMRWIVFGIIITLVPLLANLLFIASSIQTNTESMASAESQPSNDEQNGSMLELILGKGELLLITTGIAATAVGELLGSNGRRKTFIIFSGGGCVIALMLASLWYAYINSQVVVNPNSDINVELVTTGSVILFIPTVIASTLCVALAEDEES